MSANQACFSSPWNYAFRAATGRRTGPRNRAPAAHGATCIVISDVWLHGPAARSEQFTRRRMSSSTTHESPGPLTPNIETFRIEREEPSPVVMYLRCRAGSSRPRLQVQTARRERRARPGVPVKREEKHRHYTHHRSLWSSRRLLLHAWP